MIEEVSSEDEGARVDVSDDAIEKFPAASRGCKQCSSKPAVTAAEDGNNDDISFIAEPPITHEDQVQSKYQSTVQSVNLEQRRDNDVEVQAKTPDPFERSSLPTKKCFECGNEKPQGRFTASQWKKTKGSGKCINCVSKCPQWQSSGIVSKSLQLSKLCQACMQKKKHPEFTQNQWKRPVGTGRCRVCVKKGLLPESLIKTTH